MSLTYVQGFVYSFGPQSIIINSIILENYQKEVQNSYEEYRACLAA